MTNSKGLIFFFLCSAYFLFIFQTEMKVNCCTVRVGISLSVGGREFTGVLFHHRLHQRLLEEYHLVYVQRIYSLLKQYLRI